MTPVLIPGSCFSDNRGLLLYNNSFDALAVRRLYVIQNCEIGFVRAWQGHRIEQRWFSALQGSVSIRLIAIDNWDNPSRTSEHFAFLLEDKQMNVLHVPPGYVSSIQSGTEGARLLVMCDYRLGELKDEYRFPVDYFSEQNCAG
ncbi:MAG: sugar epimerase [Ferruginibacter sp.]